jgi:hypothetical protein
VIISYDIPEDLTQSVLIVFDGQFNHTPYLSDIRNKTKYISPSKTGLNYFRVTSIEFIPGTDILVIAVLNYGLVLYSVEKEVIIKFLSLIDKVRYSPFRI